MGAGGGSGRARGLLGKLGVGELLVAGQAGSFPSRLCMTKGLGRVLALICPPPHTAGHLPVGVPAPAGTSRRKAWRGVGTAVAQHPRALLGHLPLPVAPEQKYLLG